MTVNIGTIDRIFRALLGVALIAIALVSGAIPAEAGALKWVTLAAGAIMLATSAMKFCPLYRLAGVRTCKIK